MLDELAVNVGHDVPAVVARFALDGWGVRLSEEVEQKPADMTSEEPEPVAVQPSGRGLVSGKYQGLGFSMLGGMVGLEATYQQNGETVTGSYANNQGDFGPIQLGATGHLGEGMDGFQVFPFNPIYVSLAPENPYEAKFRPTKAYLIHLAAHYTPEGWVSLGFGQSLFDRVEGDPPIETLDQAPLLRRQTGISAGAYYRLGGSVVIGVDYFRASYGFDDRYITPPPGSPDGATAAIVSSHQTVHALNAGTTLEW